MVNKIKSMKMPYKSLKYKRYFIIDSSFSLFRLGWVVSEKMVNKLKIKFTINDGSDSSIKMLTKLKIIFSTQLPNIPRLYIRKQLLEKKHVLLTLIKFTDKKKKLLLVHVVLEFLNPINSSN